MQTQELAAFVRRPRRIEELHGLHLVANEHPFAIIKTVELEKIDYQNFATDLLADRQYLEDYAELCGIGDVWRSILVRQIGRPDGVLVLPAEDGCHIEWAAYYQILRAN
ncbi:MAG: hypothetical protein IJ206_00670 [Oscillospiraceae bacterium]|nr:hypothetical protein [Oscillospiraceae bacterium]